MKVEVKPGKSSQEVVYPCLMVSESQSDLMVLFSGRGRGVVVVGNAQFPLGHHSATWSDAFSQFHGTVTLSNS